MMMLQVVLNHFNCFCLKKPDNSNCKVYIPLEMGLNSVSKAQPVSLAVTAPGESPLTCSESALLLNRYADACPCGRKRHNLAVYICQDRVTGRGWASVTPPSDVTAHGSQAKFKFHLNSQPTQPAGTSLTCNKRASPSAGLLNGNTTWMPGPTGPPTQ